MTEAITTASRYVELLYVDVDGGNARKARTARRSSTH